MINCIVSIDSQGPYYSIGAVGMSWGDQSLTLEQIPFSPHARNVVATSAIPGMKPRRGRKVVVGTKREKEVSHLNATGTLEASSTRLVHSDGGGGWYFVQRDRHRPCRPVLCLGESRSSRVEVLFEPRVSYTDTMTPGPAMIRQEVNWISETTFSVVTWLQTPEVSWFPSGRYQPGTTSCVVEVYQVLGTVLRKRVNTNASPVLWQLDVNALLFELTTSAPNVNLASALVGLELESSIGTAALLAMLEENARSVYHMPADVLLLEEHPTDFGDLTVDIMDGLDVVKDNIVTMMFDVIEWKTWAANAAGLAKQIPKMPSRVWKALRRGKARLPDLGHVPVSLPDIDFVKGKTKESASMYLVWKYVALTTLSDVTTIVDGLLRQLADAPKSARRQSRKVVQLLNPYGYKVLHTAVLTVVTAPFPESVLGKLTWLIELRSRYGLHPGLEQGWDVIPYSFVLDKVIQVGDFFEDTDNWLRAEHRFPVLFSVLSEKWSVDLDAHAIAPDVPGASGVVKFSYYVRWIEEGRAPSPSVSLESENRLWGSFTPQLVALVAQKRL